MNRLALLSGVALVALSLGAAPSAHAQNAVCPDVVTGTSNNQCANTKFVRDAISGAVTSFNGRTGAVVPATNDYSFSQLSGQAALTQLPSIATNTVLGNVGSLGTPTALTSSQLSTLLGLGTFATANAATPPAIGGTTPAAGAFTSLTVTGITGATQCVQITSGVLSGTGAACGSGSGAVNSVTNSDGTLTISPTTGSVVASLALGHANTWTGTQTFTAPVLGTPASGTLTNATGLPISTGVSGLGTGIATFLGTPSSANLAAAVTNETGTGFLVFATAPTLTGNVAISSVTTTPALTINSPIAGGPFNVKQTTSFTTVAYFEGAGSTASPSGVPLWFTLSDRSTDHAVNINIQVLNSANVLIDQAFALNPGLQFNDAGHEQSDIDFNGYINGVFGGMFGFRAGCNTANNVSCPGNTPPSFVPSTDATTDIGQQTIGSFTYRFNNLWLAGVLSVNQTSTLPSQANITGTTASIVGSPNNFVLLDAYGTTPTPAIIGRSANGTSGSPTATQNNDNLFAFGGRGLDGTNGFSAANTVLALFSASENYTATAHGSKMSFGTTKNGTTTRSTVFTIDGYGHLSILGPSAAVPAITSCGTSPSVATGSDTAGEVTEGTTATGCTITFANAYTSKPYCTVTAQTQQAAFSYTPSTTAIVVTNTSASNIKINWVCVGA